ncbi:hypothetical protein GBA52_026996 [Prunus armeniaca]|nr:hypothetical protein GBA52_026996 [Prunus armeniaca]
MSIFLTIALLVGGLVTLLRCVLKNMKPSHFIMLSPRFEAFDSLHRQTGLTDDEVCSQVLHPPPTPPLPNPAWFELRSFSYGDSP